MTRALQFLLAAAAVVIIAAGCVFLAGAKREADERAEQEAFAAWMRNAQAEALADAQKARRQSEIDACAADLAAYDGGDAYPFMVRATASGAVLTGETMLAEVAKCRGLVAH